MTTAVFVVHNYINFLICKKISEQYEEVIFATDRQRLMQEITAEFDVAVRDLSNFSFKSSLNFKHSKRIREHIRTAINDVDQYEIFVPTMRNRVSQVLVYDPRCTQFSLVEEGYPGPYNTEKTLTQQLSDKVGTPHFRRLITNALYMNEWVDFKYFYYHHPKFSGNTYAIHQDAFPESPNQIVVKNIYPKVDISDRDILVLPHLMQLPKYFEHIKSIVEENNLKFYKPHPSNSQEVINYFDQLGLERITTPLEIIHQNSDSIFHIIVYHFPGSICHYTAEKNLVQHQLSK